MTMIWNNTHLCLPLSETSYKAVSLVSIIQTMSLYMVDELVRNDHRGCSSLESTEMHEPLNNNVCELKRGNSFLHLDEDTSLKVVKGDGEGVYLVVLEGWNDVKYLQVSNAQGYVLILNGAFFVPTKHQSAQQHGDVSARALHCLWTDGSQILCNYVSKGSTIRHGDLRRNIPSVELQTNGEIQHSSKSSSSSWKQCIERSLERTCSLQSLYKEQILRCKRRRYILDRSIEVLDELEDKESKL